MSILWISFRLGGSLLINALYRSHAEEAACLQPKYFSFISLRDSEGIEMIQYLFYLDLGVVSVEQGWWASEKSRTYVKSPCVI